MPAITDAQKKEAAEFVLTQSSRSVPVIAVAPHVDLHELLTQAQTFLESSVESVNHAILAAANLNYLRKTAQGVSPQGQYSEEVQDLLRAAVLFAGASLDGVLKQLVRDAAPTILDLEHEPTVKAFKSWSRRYLDGGEGAATAKAVAGVLTSRDPRAHLIEAWVQDLTYDSAQSNDRIKDLAGALGVADVSDVNRWWGRDASKLRDAFSARNEVAHEFDLTPPAGERRTRFEKTRRTRRRTEVVRDCRAAAEAIQDVINATSDLLRRIGA